MKLKFATNILIGACISVTSFAQWKPAEIDLATRWTKQVSPDNALTEYPRPQMVRTQWQNLNGLWQYAITQKDAPVPSSYTGKILVPFPIESALSGVKKSVLPNQNLWYKRQIARPALKNGERALLHFGAVDWQANVFLNGKPVGEHTGGYQSFTCDITDALQEANNELTVKVYDPTDQGPNPHGKQVLKPANIYYTPTTGIWQTVWLEIVPAAAISGIKMTPDVDKGVLNVSVKAPEGYEVALTALKDGKPAGTAKGSSNSGIQLPVKDARLWSPADPFLYDLQVQLVKKGKTVDEVKSYFGMRKVEIKKDAAGHDRIFLNNQYTYNLGTLDQGFWPDGLYTAPTDEALAFDIKAIKAMGFNTIRKHIKVEPARWYYHCDKLGMLVWQDFVNPPHHMPEGAKKEFEKEVAATMEQLHNHPSITTWVLFNEKWGAYDQQRLTEWVKQKDPSRLVNGHSGEILYVNEKLRSPSPNAWVSADMTDVHSYPNPRNAPARPGKVRVLGEFGGIGAFIPEHQWNPVNAWGYIQVTPAMLKEKYAAMNQQLLQLEKDGLTASIYTQPFDVEGEQNGLMTYDREIVKIPFDTLRNIHKQLAPNLEHYPVVTAQNADIANPKEIYNRMLSEYQKGRKEPKFLIELAVMAKQFKDQENEMKISKDYMDQIEEPYTTNDLNFLQSVTTSKNDPGFQFIIKQADAIEKVPNGGTQTVDIALTIIRKEIRAEINKNKLSDLDVLKTNMINQYGKIGELAALEEIALYYFLKKNVPNFVKYKQQIINKFPNRINNWILANDSWFVFENAEKSDRESLLIGLSWSEKIVREEPNNAPNLDTYANILYKLGRKEVAISWQEKALKAEPGRKEIINNLEKMKKGIPTWK